MSSTGSRGWRDLSWGRREPDPYGRHAWWVFALYLALVAAILLGACLVAGVGREPAAPTWPEAIALVLLIVGWLAFSLAVFWWRPRPTGVGVGSARVLRVSLIRRLSFLMLPQPLWLFLLVPFPSGNSPSASTFAVLVLPVTAMLWLASRERIAVTEQGVERIAGLDPHRKVAWSDVTAIRVFPTGVIVEHRAGKPLHVFNRYLDGYPELVREVLRRIPQVVDSTPEARERLERVAALAPDRP